MNNILSLGVVTVGNEKRIAVIYQVVDETGKVTDDNQRTNKIITNDDVLKAVSVLNDYAQSIVDGTEYKPESSNDTSATTDTQNDTTAS